MVKEIGVRKALARNSVTFEDEKEKLSLPQRTEERLEANYSLPALQRTIAVTERL